jgi:hypothetical protein
MQPNLIIEESDTTEDELRTKAGCKKIKTN